MKKLLLSALLSMLIFASANAQIRWSTNTTIGQELKAVNTADKDTLILDFKNTVSFSTVCAWAPARATANLGKDSCYKKTLQTQKGIQVKAFLNTTTTTAYENGSFKCNNAGGNGNPGRVASVDSLKKYLAKSIITGTVNGSTNDSLSRPAACLFNVGADEIAFGMYPGKATKIEYLFRFDYSSKACTDDITFEVNTYDAGNSGKTAKYGLAVYKSSVSDANLLGSKVENFYTTGQGLKVVHLASEIGLTPSDLSNKSLYIVISTLGTNNDGLPNAVDANNIPIVTDPIIVFDNFFLTYASASWSQPEGVVASSVFNHNNGSPVNLGVSSTDYSGGTPVPVAPNVSTPIYFYITSNDRIGALDITEGNDGGAHSAAYSFATTGAVMKKDINGNYTIPVDYTYTPSDGTSKMDLLIAAPTSGSVSEALQVAVTVNTPSNATRAVRLEITNGIRFWYNISAIGDLGTGIEPTQNADISVYSSKNTLFAINATENVVVTNVAGQRISVATPAQAARGLQVQNGIYIVKTGSFVQKVMIK